MSSAKSIEGLWSISGHAPSTASSKSTMMKEPSSFFSSRIRPRPEKIVGYAECAYEISGSDNWLNKHYPRNHEMRPLFVEELAVHPDLQGCGLGSFILEQVEHLAKLRGCTHIVLEVAENNPRALQFYRKRRLEKLDAAVFLAKKVSTAPSFCPFAP